MQDRLLRLSQIIGTDGSQPLIPVGRTTFWQRVKDGEFPQPVRLGTRTVAWRESDIQKLIQSFSSETGK